MRVLVLLALAAAGCRYDSEAIHVHVAARHPIGVLVVADASAGRLTMETK
jgi:hypothetical protein